MVSLLGAQFMFFNSLGPTKISAIFKLALYIHILSFSESLQNNLNHASTLNIREVRKFYNLGYKRFATDFSYRLLLLSDVFRRR